MANTMPSDFRLFGWSRAFLNDTLNNGGGSSYNVMNSTYNNVFSSRSNSRQTSPTRYIFNGVLDIDRIESNYTEYYNSAIVGDTITIEQSYINLSLYDVKLYFATIAIPSSGVWALSDVGAVETDLFLLTPDITNNTINIKLNPTVNTSAKWIDKIVLLQDGRARLVLGYTEKGQTQITVINVDNSTGFINKTLLPITCQPSTSYTVSMTADTGFTVTSTPHLTITDGATTLVDTDLTLSDGVYSTSVTFDGSHTNVTATYTGYAEIPITIIPITNNDNTEGFINKTLFPSSVTVGTAYTISIEKPTNYDIITAPHIKIVADGNTLLDTDMVVSGDIYITSYTFSTIYTSATVTYTGVAREHITPPTDKTIILYKNISDNNALNKTLLNPVNREIVFKEVTDIYNPEIILSINILDFNYCYIPVFHRYYFIENKQVIRKGLFKISCRCDVLASFKNDILASEGTITKTSNYNPYYGDFKSEVRTQTRILNFENNFNEDGQLVLITVSG